MSDYNGVDEKFVAVVGNPGVGSDEWQYSDSRCGYARSDCRDDLLFNIMLKGRL